MLARLRSSMAARSLGTHQEESSVPSSSPSTSLSVCEEEQVVAQPHVSPPGGPGKPPSPLGAEGGVTRMIGGLEMMKMGELKIMNMMKMMMTLMIMNMKMGILSMENCDEYSQSCKAF